MASKKKTKAGIEEAKDNSPYVFERDKIKIPLTIKSIPWTEKQKKFIELVKDKNTKMVLVNGPAGTSKTLLSIYCGLYFLTEHILSDIILVRTAVESADSKLGYLPGDISEKMNAYAVPFYDKLSELLPQEQIKALFKDERINVVPVNYARGLHWAGKYIFIDEAQNMTVKELKTILTRVGKFCKVIIAGDSEQNDIPKNKSGWLDTFAAFTSYEAEKHGIYCFEFGEEDILRSELCKYVVEVFKRIEALR